MGRVPRDHERGPCRERTSAGRRDLGDRSEGHAVRRRAVDERQGPDVRVPHVRRDEVRRRLLRLARKQELFAVRDLVRPVHEPDRPVELPQGTGQGRSPGRWPQHLSRRELHLFSRLQKGTHELQGRGRQRDQGHLRPESDGRRGRDDRRRIGGAESLFAGRSVRRSRSDREALVFDLLDEPAVGPRPDLGRLGPGLGSVPAVYALPVLRRAEAAEGSGPSGGQQGPTDRDQGGRDGRDADRRIRSAERWIRERDHRDRADRPARQIRPDEDHGLGPGDADRPRRVRRQ